MLNLTSLLLHLLSSNSLLSKWRATAHNTLCFPLPLRDGVLAAKEHLFQPPIQINGFSACDNCFKSVSKLTRRVISFARVSGNESCCIRAVSLPLRRWRTCARVVNVIWDISLILWTVLGLFTMPADLDLSYLTSEEKETILSVLERDSELRELEQARIR